MNTTFSYPSFRVLVVEDNHTNQTVISWMLKKLGYLYDIAEHGELAIEHFLSKQEYHLIFMDLRMPVLDGFGATKAIRAIEQEKNLDPIPIIALTADVLGDVAIQCQTVGMNGFLTKPISHAAMKETLDRWLPIVDSVQ